MKEMSTVLYETLSASRYACGMTRKTIYSMKAEGYWNG